MMVIPIENSFQNWTRSSADLLGYAYLYLDYTVPVEPLRKKLQEIVAASKQWDRKVCGLQVTNLKESTMEVRCLTSASNSADSFDLCCIIREQMMGFVQENYPEAFRERGSWRTRRKASGRRDVRCPHLLASSDSSVNDFRRRKSAMETNCLILMSGSH